MASIYGKLQPTFLRTRLLYQILELFLSTIIEPVKVIQFYIDIGHSEVKICAVDCLYKSVTCKRNITNLFAITRIQLNS